MAAVYVFALPTTGAASFAGALGTGQAAQLVADADAARARVRDTLKRARRGAADSAAAVNALEEYLPYAAAVRDGVACGRLGAGDIVTAWRPAIVPASAVGPIKVRVTLADEPAVASIAYALALAARAEDTLAGGAAGRFQAASGLLLQAQAVLAGVAAAGGSTPDVQPANVAPLIAMLAGSVHLVVIYRALAEPGTTPPGLLARGAIYAAERFGAAATQLPRALAGDAVVRWLEDARALASAYAARFLAVAAEAKGDVGRAIALCAAARADARSSSVPRRDTSALRERRRALQRELDELERTYRAHNDRIAFQPVPDARDAAANWPSGRELVPARAPWTPTPAVTFGDAAAPAAAGRDYSGRGQYY
ncbi:uncharacterized protein V1510DRAFT_434949 [Dipodascopsis tothii]|uniref:uncharacterized protein n=1 Tax=Dipodascopsis tothii TaxID=44089 RepID=UPI0034CD93E9